MTLYNIYYLNLPSTPYYFSLLVNRIFQISLGNINQMINIFEYRDWTIELCPDIGLLVKEMKH